MTERGKSILADARQVAALVAIVAAFGSAAWWVAGFVISTQTRELAAKEHRELREETMAAVQKVDLRTIGAEIKATTAIDEIKHVGRDVRTIKCLMLAPTTKAKGRCGLE